jgi:hypothetical protein
MWFVYMIIRSFLNLLLWNSVSLVKHWTFFSVKSGLFVVCWIDWLIDYFVFYIPLKNISLIHVIWRRHHCRWRAAKFWRMLGAQGLWAGRDHYCATPTVTRDLGFSGLIRRTPPFSCLLRHTRGCGGSILTRILTGLLNCWIENHSLNSVS